MALFVCSTCQFGSATWIGKCPGCGEWNTLVQKQEETGSQQSIHATPTEFRILKKKTISSPRLVLGLFEFDRVLGGGLIPGEIVLLSGEPGIGKSTLLMQVVKNVRTAYVSGEEAADQIHDRMRRLGVAEQKVLFSDETKIENILAGLSATKDVQLVVIDSIQMMYSTSIDAPPGSINQIKDCLTRITFFAKQNKIPFIIIGHVTKDGDLAGPKTLEHMVDCVLTLEGDNETQFRILRSSKNRYGNTNEIGVFEMNDTGLKEVDATTALLSHGSVKEIGRAIVGICEGMRPMFVEVQALVVPTVLPVPRRISKGVDYNRIQLLLAIAKKYLSLKLDVFDVYINVVGGMKITSPLADLGIIAALYSSITGTALSRASVFIGEVGLLGEIRPHYLSKKTVHEARRLKMKPISPETVPSIGALKKLIASS